MSDIETIMPTTEGVGGIQFSELTKQIASLGKDGIEMMERVEGMWERQMERDRVQAFSRSMAKVKRQAPSHIPHDCEADFNAKGGNVRYSYASVAAMRAVYDPILAEHGMWVTEGGGPSDDGKHYTAIYYLHHEDGYTREAGFTVTTAMSDKLPINAQQKMAWVDTFAGRRALRKVLGIATKEDDDEQLANSEVRTLISEEQSARLDQLLEQMEEVGGPDAPVKAMRVLRDYAGLGEYDSLVKLPEALYQEAFDNFTKRVNALKADREKAGRQ